MTDLKNSILVSKQLPGFVLEDYPKFVAFVEAYYEFLETQYGTNANDLISEAKRALSYTDVDESLDKFEEYFFNNYLNGFPKSSVVSEDILIKNSAQIYKSKGSKQSFELLFKLLFNEKVDIRYPKENILRASDGRWVVPKILRVYSQIFSIHETSGTQTSFKICPLTNTNEIRVYLNDVLQTETSDYYVRLENKTLNFYAEPVGTIKVEYLNFDERSLVNRQIVGVLSNTKAVIENIVFRSIGLENYYEIQLPYNFSESFLDYEKITTNIFVDNILIDLQLDLVSGIAQTIEIQDGGSGYNVGDPVFIIGDSTRGARAVVDKIASGDVRNIIIENGGSGFKVGNNVRANSVSSLVFNAYVSRVDENQNNILKSVTLNKDIISDFANVTLDSVDYGFSSNVQISEDINTVISSGLNFVTLSNLAPIKSVTVSTSSLNRRPELVVDSTLVANTGNTIIRISDFGIIGKLKIVSGGQNYQVGDSLVFTNTVEDNFFSRGASAQVSAVTNGGTITKIQITNGGLGYSLSDPPNITVASSNGSNAIITIDSIMGKNESLVPIIGSNAFGEIISIKVVDPGLGYKIPPQVDLSQFGNGDAKAIAITRNSQVDLPGKWITTDGLLSSDKVLEGNDYYTDFTYVISSKVAFNQFKELFKNLIHPAGFKPFAEYLIDDYFNVANVSSIPEVNWLPVQYGLPGLFDVQSDSPFIIDANSYFEISNATGMLTVGTYIVVNSEIRIVNAIINNTTITVSEPFYSNLSNAEIFIFDPGYEAIVTEYYRELTTQGSLVPFSNTVIVVEHSEE